MKDCYYYFCVEPLRADYRDDATVTPLLVIPVEGGDRVGCSIAFLGEPNDLRLIRIKITQCDGDTLNARDCSLIQDLKEHALSVLRICYDVDMQVHPMMTWYFVESGASPNMHILAGHGVNPDWRVDVANLRSVLVASYPVRDVLKLLSDALNQHIPPQFRYLSLYVLLEHEYKVKGKWTRDFAELTAGFETVCLAARIGDSGREIG